MAGGVTSPVFVGRRRELAQLEAALEDARAGRPRTILVAGEAGVGKTRLVRESTASAAAHDARVLAGGCLPAGAVGLPYAPFADAIRRLVRSVEPSRLGSLLGSSRSGLANLVPDLAFVLAGTTPPPDPPRAPFELMLGALRSLARSSPVVLVLEDLHWADRSTLDVISFLARDLVDERVVLIGTFRTDELPPRNPLGSLVAELARTRRVDRIDLEPFDREGTRDLLAGVLGREPEPSLVTTIHERSGGNAYYAEELLAVGGAEGRLPSTLRDALLARIGSLDEATRDLLRVASVGGASIDADVLARVADAPEASLTTGLRDALGRHVIVPIDQDADRFAFRHALLGEAIYAELMPGERRRLHARFAMALERGGATDPTLAAELAHHWAMAGDRRRALAASVRAGYRARSVPAFATAQAQFERAVQLWPSVPEASELAGCDLAKLLELAADCAGGAGATTRAVAHLRAALALVDPATDPVRSGLLYDRLGEFAGRAGDVEAAAAAHARAVRLVPPDPPSPARARVVEGLARRRMLDHVDAEAARLAREAVELARRTGSTAVEADALATLGAAESSQGHADVADRILRRGREIGLRSGNEAAAGRAWSNLVANLEGEACVREALAASAWNAEHGYERSTGAYTLAIALDVLWELGRWSEASELIERIRSGAMEPVYELMADLTQAQLQLGRGDEAAVARRLPALRALVDLTAIPEFQVALADVAARVRLASGDPSAARDAVGGGLTVLASLPIGSRAGCCRILATALRIEADSAAFGRSHADPAVVSVASGRGSDILVDARDLAAAIAAAGATGWRRPGAVLALCEAEATRLAGAPSAASWRRAADAARDAGQVHALPYTLLRLAEAMLASGHERTAAIPVLREADAIARSMGALPLDRAIEALAHRARIDLRPMPDARAARAERIVGGELTRREREVLGLVAAGCSNRQIADRLFIGERTAGVHVSNILAKLGASRRTEAVAVGRRLGLVDEEAVPAGPP